MSLLKVKYIDASAKQLAVANKALFEKKGVSAVLPELKSDSFSKKYPPYDSKGNLTLVGKAMRQTDLAKLGLDENATIGEYLSKSWNNFQAKITNLVQVIEKNYHK